MHDIVRHNVITRHTKEELASLQTSVVEDVLAARPKSGFGAGATCAPGTLEAYVAGSLWWHLRNAMTTPDDAILGFSELEDIGVGANVAVAFGEETLVDLAKSKQASGDIVGAARCAWAAHWLQTRGTMTATRSADLMYQAAELLLMEESGVEPRSKATGTPGASGRWRGRDGTFLTATPRLTRPSAHEHDSHDLLHERWVREAGSVATVDPPPPDSPPTTHRFRVSTTHPGLNRNGQLCEDSPDV